MDYSWPPFHAAETSLKEHNFNIFSGTGGALWQDWWCFSAGLVVLYSGTGGALQWDWWFFIAGLVVLYSGTVRMKLNNQNF